MAARMTGGPRVNDASLSWLVSPNSTKEGVGGWWDQWMSTLQDYRAFGPVHGGSCNVMFADGSVRLFYDKNADRQLNNGFSAGNGFSDATEELPQTDFHSRYSVMAANRN
jgi:prepilin-type processing-associated H-X9-DG protein